MSCFRCVQGLLFNVTMWVVVDLMVLNKIENDYLNSIWLVYQITYIAFAFAHVGCLHFLLKKLINDMDQNVANDIIIVSDKKSQEAI